MVKFPGCSFCKIADTLPSCHKLLDLFIRFYCVIIIRLRKFGSINESLGYNAAAVLLK